MTSTGIDYDHSRVILLGTSVYRDRGFRNVRAVSRSLREMLAALTDPELGGWPAGRIEYWHNKRDAHNVIRRIRGIAHDTTGVLIFYFVGHGTIASRSGELCLILPDTMRDHPDLTGLDYGLVRDALMDSPATAKIVILDCCFSGRAIGHGLSSGDVADLSHIHGAYTLTACNSRQQIARASDKGEPTSFTRELLGLMYRGLPSGGATLCLDDLFWPLQERLRSRDLPMPDCKEIDSGGRLPFVLNPARTDRYQGESGVGLVMPENRPLPRAKLSLRAQTRRMGRRDVLRAAGAALVVGAGIGAGIDAAEAFWRPGPLVPKPLGRHPSQAWNVVTGQWRGRPAAVSSGSDGSIYTWDLAKGTRAGTLQNGTPVPDTKHGVRGLALAYPDGPGGDPLLITGSDDASVRVWSLARSQAIGSMQAGHAREVRALTTATVNGQHLVISGSYDGTTSVCDLATGRQVGHLATGSQVNSVTTGLLAAGAERIPVAVTGTDGNGGKTVQVWTLSSYHGTAPYQEISSMNTGFPVYAVALGSVAGRTVLVTGDAASNVRFSGDKGGFVRFWGLNPFEELTSAPTMPQLSDWAWGTAIGQLGSRVIAVSVGDGTGRVWDLSNGDRQLTPFQEQGGSIWGISLTEVAGTHYAVTAGLSGLILVWDLDTE